MQHLKQHWFTLFQNVTEPEILEKEFMRLSGCYSEKQRFYHTLDHISDAFRKLDEVAGFIDDFTNIGIAIFYHDVVYDPQRDDNEYQSAFFAARFLEKCCFPKSQIQKVKGFILLTGHPSVPVSDDEKFLIDIDLSVLGADHECFVHYERNIRKEYSFVPEDLYRWRRTAFLRALLGNNIYHTSYFREKYEIQARKNISSLLDSMQD